MEERIVLQQRLRDFIEHVDMWSSCEATQSVEQAQFQRLALDLFRYQFENNIAYQRLCKRRGKTPSTVQRWQDIPAISSASFKSVPLFTAATGQAARVFHTSGTTRGRAGKHYFRTLELYRIAALRSFQWACLPDLDRLPILVLGPTADLFPHSSLGQMFSWIVQTHGDDRSRVLFTPEGTDFVGSSEWLLARMQEKAPVLILATSLALLSWCDNPISRKQRLHLPEGSRILDTGGTKGRKRQIERRGFLQRLSTTFGLHPEWIFNEYGMTEMSSQFYQTRFLVPHFGKNVHVGPPWLRSLACDPDTLALLPPGKAGVLRHFDLANFDSVAMLQTEDMGRAQGRRITLRGRALDAEPRGCSLLAEEILSP